MPLLRDEQPAGASQRKEASGSMPNLTNPPGALTRSSSPSGLTSELLLRVNAQYELMETLDDLLTQADEPVGTMMLTEVNMMLEQAEELHATFRSEHSWLLSNWPPAHLDHPYLARKISSNEAKLQLKIKRSLGRLKEQLTQPAQPAATPESERPRSRLPELSVPKFNGDCRKWPDFKAMFDSVIGNRSDLSSLEKFQYLKSSVTDGASDLIVNIHPDQAAFQGAWTLLTARYENKRLILKSHLERILALKPMTKRQASSLTKMVNIINETTQAVKTLTEGSNNDCIMLTLVVGLLDKDTRERWEGSLTSDNEFPTLSQLTDFLIARARTLENIEDTPAASEAKNAVPKRTGYSHAAQAAPAHSSKSSPQTAQQPSQSSQQKTSYPCDCCGQAHFIVTCSTFRGHSVEERLGVVKARSLCFNCLGRHNARKCNSTKRCRTCNSTHHTMLHGADLSSLTTTPAQTQTTQTVQQPIASGKPPSA